MVGKNAQGKEMQGNRFGLHRVIEPKGVLTQAAQKIDNSMDVLYDNEILCKVETLNVDAASFTQMEKEAHENPDGIAKMILDTVAKRGKQHNPVTGSGGMFIGTVERIGSKLAGSIDLKVGDRIASLVSLSLTPLKIDKIKKVHLDKDQVDIDGHAILFESGVYAKLPEDMPDKVALAVLDVAGAAAQTAKLVRPGDTVFILGAGGKSGMLCAYEARRRAGVNGRVIGTGHSPSSTARIRALGFCDEVIQVDATSPVATQDALLKVTGGKLPNITINCVNIENTEMTSVLCTDPHGTIYFFSMATSFTKSALGAEGIGSDVQMIIGNGYCDGHARYSLQLVRESKELRKVFDELYA
jgi:L-erythro-3,5-diaminohexanoate dehydrogenase